MNNKAKMRLKKSGMVMMWKRMKGCFINQTGNQIRKGGKRDYLDEQRSSKAAN